MWFVLNSLFRLVSRRDEMFGMDIVPRFDAEGYRKRRERDTSGSPYWCDSQNEMMR